MDGASASATLTTPTRQARITPRVAVAIEGVSKTFPLRRSWRDTMLFRTPGVARKSLDNVSISVREGELFGILGPNGAGKTTLFRIVATSLLADEGSVSVCGLDVEHDALRVRELMAVVTANERAVNWRLTARQNLELFAALYRVPVAETAARVSAVLQIVDLGAAADRPVSGYSSGMKQRVMIARALLANPRLLLLDEPTRSLDPVSARDLRRFIREVLVDTHGCTVLLATHDGDEAFHLCDRVAIMAQGRVLALDTADRLAQQFGDARAGVWTTNPAHPVFARLVADGLAKDMVYGEPDAEGWAQVAFSISNGHDAIADVFDALRSSDARIARLERLDMSIADLITRVVGAQGAGA